MKKVVAVILSCATILTTLGVTALAEDTNVSVGAVKIFDDDGEIVATASGSGSVLSADVDFDKELYISLDDIATNAGLNAKDMADEDVSSFKLKKHDGGKFIKDYDIVESKKFDSGSDAQKNTNLPSDKRGSYIKIVTANNVTDKEEKVTFTCTFKAKKDGVISAGTVAGTDTPAEEAIYTYDFSDVMIATAGDKITLGSASATYDGGQDTLEKSLTKIVEGFAADADWAVTKSGDTIVFTAKKAGVIGGGTAPATAPADAAVVNASAKTVKPVVTEAGTVDDEAIYTYDFSDVTIGDNITLGTASATYDDQETLEDVLNEIVAGFADDVDWTVINSGDTIVFTAKEAGVIGEGTAPATAPVDATVVSTSEKTVKPVVTKAGADLIAGAPAVAGAKDGDKFIFDATLWLSNPKVSDDNSTGVAGIYSPEDNEENTLTWDNGSDDVAEVVFNASDDADDFYVKLSTKSDNDVYAEYGDPVNATLFFRSFVGTPTLPTTSRATLKLFNPFEDDEDVDPEDIYIYENDGGVLTDITSKFAWDSDEECWSMKTRTLGSYVISDTELELDEIVEEEVVDETTADTDAGTTAPEKYNPATGRW